MMTKYQYCTLSILIVCVLVTSELARNEALIWMDRYNRVLLDSLARSLPVNSDKLSNIHFVYDVNLNGSDFFDTSNIYRSVMSSRKQHASLHVDNLLMLSEKKPREDIITELTARGLTCLTYNNTLSNDTDNIQVDNICAAYRLRETITEAIVKQGQWSHVVLIGVVNNTFLVQRLGNRKRTVVDCKATETHLTEILSSVKSKDDYVGIILDCSEAETHRIVKQVDKCPPGSPLEHVPLNWLVTSSGRQLYKTIGNSIRDDDNLVILETIPTSYKLIEYIKKWLNGEDIALGFVDVYRCMSNCKQTGLPLHIGSYTSYRDILNNKQTILPAKFKQFYGRHIKIAYNQYPPFIYKLKCQEKPCRLTGIEKDLIDVLAAQLNFSYSFYKSPDGKWGALHNGTWNGLIGMVVRKEVDMAVGGIAITRSRETAVDFTTPYHRETSAVILLVPARRWSYFYEVFQLNTWIFIGCLPFLMTLTMCLVYAFSSEYDFCSTQPATVLYICFGNLMFQGIDFRSGISSIRILKSFYWLTIIILVATYSGNLTARLAIAKIEMPFTTLEELADDKYYTLLIQRSTTREDLFKNSVHGLYRRLWEKIQEAGERSFVNSTSAAMARLQSESKIAYLADKTDITQHRSKKICSDGVLLPEEFHNSGFGLVIKQRAPYEKRLNLIISRILQAGLIQYWYTTNADHTPCGAGNRISTFGQTVTVADMYYVFMMLAVGLAVSCLCFVLELLAKNEFTKKLVVCKR